MAVRYALLVILLASAVLADYKEDWGEKRLVRLSPTETEWMTRSDMYKLLGKGIHLKDITDHREAAASRTANPPGGTIPTTLTQQEPMSEFVPQLSNSKISETDHQLSEFYTRYYTKDTGVEAAKWLHKQYQDIINEHKFSAASVTLFENSFPQPSVICRIEGNGDNKDQKVILGAHLDSVTWPNPNSRSPGADDDGSGSSTVLEVFRVLAQNGWVGSRTVEFHGYAAEEVGLLGSQAIAEDYAKNNYAVVGMLQLDMVGYPNPNNAQLLVIDQSYTNETLNEFLQKCASEYASIGWTNGKCGYACSDHASFTEVGYKASFGTENGTYFQIHSKNDVPANLDFMYALEFAKMALGFVVELGAYPEN